MLRFYKSYYLRGAVLNLVNRISRNLHYLRNNKK